MGALVVVAALVFVAEMGDKSQLVALSFASRYPARSVLAGLAVAAAVMHGLSVTIGAAVAAVVPDRVVAGAGGLLFLAFALWTLRRGDDDLDGDVPAVPPRARRVVSTVAGAFLAAELGDKTMLASATLAATHGPLTTWAGATVGMVAASALAVALGSRLTSRVRPGVVRGIAALGFVVVGALLLAGALSG